MTIGLFEMINIGACNHGLEISTTPWQIFPYPQDLCLCKDNL
jgi:hypothetical protein